MTIDNGIERLADTLLSGHFDMCDLEDAADAMQRLKKERNAWKRRAEIAELQEATPKWISIEDQLPPLGEIVLLTNGAHMEFVRTNSSSWGPNCIVDVTHWMRLPELPNGTRK